MTPLALDASDRALLDGRGGKAAQLAMGIVVEMARVAGADRLIDVTRAHIDGGLYHGRAGVDFADRLVSAGARVGVPTTLNVGSLDLVHPDRYLGDAATREEARRLMELYVAMGCEPTWTCAPYQLPSRPGLGEHIAWAESNAIVFANSVLGARTDRYGDFMDICAAITGRVPYAGLHRAENRRGRAVFSVRVPARMLEEHEVLYPLLGHVVGAASGDAVPVIEGLPQETTEDALKALGAAAASSGSVALFHAVGVTPEAASRADAVHGTVPETSVDVTLEMLLATRDALTTARTEELDAVSLGTPHFSVAEFAELVALLGGGSIHPRVEFFVSTSRSVLADVERRGWRRRLEDARVKLVVDTCTYITPILRTRKVAMTNSAKWAYYAPGNIGVTVIFGSMRECVRSALEGRVWRDESLWSRA